MTIENTIDRIKQRLSIINDIKNGHDLEVFVTDDPSFTGKWVNVPLKDVDIYINPSSTYWDGKMRTVKSSNKINEIEAQLNQCLQLANKVQNGGTLRYKRWGGKWESVPSGSEYLHLILADEGVEDYHKDRLSVKFEHVWVFYNKDMPDVIWYTTHDASKAEILIDQGFPYSYARID